MPRELSHLESNASLRVLLPILGLLGGLALGILRAWLNGASELDAIAIVLTWGIIGSALGMAAALASAYRVGPAQLRSVRSLGILVIVAALVLWFVHTMLAPVLAIRQ